MPKQTYAVERGGPKRLEISWSGVFKNLQVTFDGTAVGGFQTKKQLQEGGNFTLPDSSQLHVQLKQSGMSTELQLRRNGEPLPGSTSDPEQRVAQAAGLLYFIAGLNVVLGLLAEFGVEFLAKIGMGWSNVVTAAIYAGLGYLVKTKQSRVALGLAIALFMLDGVFSIVSVAQTGGSPPVGGLVGRIFLLIPLWKGMPALGELKNRAPKPA